MDYFSLVSIAVGLSMDSFAASICLCVNDKKIKLSNILKIALFFAVFQAFMPMVGWLVGTLGSSFMQHFEHIIAFVLLGYIGSKMIAEGIKTRKTNNFSHNINKKVSYKDLIILSIATSIDAMATGIILPTVVGASTISYMLLSIFIIGLVTFIMCISGSHLGRKFGEILSYKAQIIGGFILISIGIKIMLEHVV